MSEQSHEFGWIEMPPEIVATNYSQKFQCYGRVAIFLCAPEPPLLLHIGANSEGIAFQDTRIFDHPHGPECHCWSPLGFEQWDIPPESGQVTYPIDRLKRIVDTAFSDMQANYSIQHTINQQTTATARPPVA